MAWVESGVEEYSVVLRYTSLICSAVLRGEGYLREASITVRFINFRYCEVRTLSLYG